MCDNKHSSLQTGLSPSEAREMAQQEKVFAEKAWLPSSVPYKGGWKRVR